MVILAILDRVCPIRVLEALVMDGLTGLTEFEQQLNFIQSVFPLLLLLFYEVLFIVILYLKDRELDRVVKEIQGKSWKNNKRRASDSIKTFLAVDTNPFD